MIHVEYQCKPYNFTEIYGKQWRLREQWIPGRLSPPTRPGNEARAYVPITHNYGILTETSSVRLRQSNCTMAVQPLFGLS